MFLGRGHRQKSTSKLTASLRAEQQDDDGNFIQVKPRRPRAAAQPKKAGTSAGSKNSLDPLDVDDPDDEDFQTGSSGAESSDVEEVGSNDISMEEVSSNPSDLFSAEFRLSRSQTSYRPRLSQSVPDVLVPDPSCARRTRPKASACNALRLEMENCPTLARVAKFPVRPPSQRLRMTEIFHPRTLR